MDINKLKEEFNKAELLKEEIKDLNEQYEMKKVELTNNIKSLRNKWEVCIIKEIDTFFENHNFKKKQNTNEYYYGDGFVGINLNTECLPITLQIRIPKKHIEKIIRIKPSLNEEKFYYNDVPGKNLSLYPCTFSIYSLDTQDNENLLEEVKNDYLRILSLLDYSIKNLNDELSYSYYIDKGLNKEKCNTFNALFEKL